MLIEFSANGLFDKYDFDAPQSNMWNPASCAAVQKIASNAECPPTTAPAALPTAPPPAPFSFFMLVMVLFLHLASN